MYLTFQKHYLFRGTVLSKTEFLTFNNKFFYFIYRIVTLNEINMRFYGAEFRISSHHLRVETESHKNNSIEMSEDM
jgi:hypothetical protein